MRPIATDEVSVASVCLRVSVPAFVSLLQYENRKHYDSIEMPFGVWTRVGPKNHVLGGGPDPRRGMGILGAPLSDAAFRRNSLAACYRHHRWVR